MAVLAFWGENQFRLAWENVWPTWLVILAIFAGLTLCFRALGRWEGAGLSSGFVAVYLFYAPALFDWLSAPRLPLLLLNVGAALTLILIFRLLPKEPARFDFVAGRLNFMCALLMLATALPIVASQLRMEPARREALQQFPDLAGLAGPDSPDVWHILFDRYASEDTLRSRYNYDNRPFLAALRSRGFVVEESAFSNYQRTAHSVASTMNGSLLNSMSKPMSDAQSDWVPLYRAMRDNAATRTFNRMGYSTIFAGSWWEPTRFSDAAAKSIQIRAVPQLARLILDQSSLGLWLRGTSAPWQDARADQCFRANAKFDRLSAITKDKSRKHVFAHFLVPHPPFVLNSDGTCRSLADAKANSRAANYTAQVQFVNSRVIKLVDAIVAGPRPAVIVIHSDEGPWPEPYVGNEHGLGTDPVSVPWSKLPQVKLREKMGILLAIRDPSGRAPRTIPTSPVQIYPAILRDHFRSVAPLPLSKHFIFTSDQSLYRFVPVDMVLGTKLVESAE